MTLTTSQLPSHTHALPVDGVSGKVDVPSSTSYLGVVGRGAQNPYIPLGSAKTTMLAASVSAAGGGGAHNNLMPYQALNYIIALVGIFPSRS